MSAILGGPIAWTSSRDDIGWTDYNIVWRVRTTSANDGPQVVMACPGLPAIGSQWGSFGGNDFDEWAFCYPTMKVTIDQEKRGDPNYAWLVEQKFSTKPLNRCQSFPIQDPLLEPMKISGGFERRTFTPTKDKDGNLIQSSSFEPFTGGVVDFDYNSPTVRVQQNVGSLGLSSWAGMIDTVNSGPMWGLPARCIKLSNASWERLVYGVCGYYFSLAFDFSINYNTWDRVIRDQGTKVLNGHWGDPNRTPPDASTGWILDTIGGSPPNVNNPQHYTQYKDRNDQPGTVSLNGAGLPQGPEDDPFTWNVQYYTENDFFELGIPADLER